jgi:hypothetical protein
VERTRVIFEAHGRVSTLCKASADKQANVIELYKTRLALAPRGIDVFLIGQMLVDEAESSVLMV